MSASVAVTALLVLGMTASVISRVKGREADPRIRTIWALGGWGVLLVVGLAVWLIAQTQLQH